MRKMIFLILLFWVTSVRGVGAAELKIRFLGTGAANQSGIPNASLLVGGDTIIDFSCYSGGVCGVARLRAMQVNLDGIRRILFTHYHADHFDPASVVQLAEARGVAAGKLAVYGGSEVVNQMNSYLASTGKGGLVSVVHLEKRVWTNVGQYRVMPLLANHDLSVFENYVYVVEYMGARFLYATDSDVINGESLTTLDGMTLNLVIRDGTFHSCGNAAGHMNYCTINSERADWISRGIITATTPYYLTHMVKWSLPWCNNACSLVFGVVASDGQEVVLMVADPTPTRIATCLVCSSGLPKSRGNTNCDSTINMLDFAAWYAEYQAYKSNGNQLRNNWNADFNCDQRVNTLDFATWYAGYVGG